MTKKTQVLELLKSIETGNPAPAGVINPQKYIQHNLSAADGLEGFRALLKLLPPGSAKVKTVRIFEDGDYVFAHTVYDFFGPKIGFDVFRFENGKIVEHWDNLQETAAATLSGRSMTDGPVEAADHAKTAANKQRVADFTEDVLLGKNPSKISEYISAEHYAQHNPGVADGLEGLIQAIQALNQAGTPMTYMRTHKILGEGNFVLVLSEGQFLNQHVAFYDLFRVERGSLVEHWDVIEPIPPQAEWKNANGKF